MSDREPLEIFFNFRSPYCYLASKRMFDLLQQFDIDLLWRPLAGWSGRSAPERQKSKLAVVRQDVKRFCRKLDIPFTPPPMHTDGTLAALGSLAAEKAGLLQPYVIGVMHQEWGEGNDIGDIDVLYRVAEDIGLARSLLDQAVSGPANEAVLDLNWQIAQEKGAFGVPTFIVGGELFWGNDRIDFVADLLREKGFTR
ncbi:2-hydroxychromene-2-carboxylate isomerase [Amphritea sp. HPY]|uniref:2-hydroxychromene-2-carboxylate isomerase n=1 Tax=Amphritea sp. HPY TaxID=3421652 RepID=UPI003D7EE9EE